MLTFSRFENAFKMQVLTELVSCDCLCALFAYDRLSILNHIRLDAIIISILVIFIPICFYSIGF